MMPLAYVVELRLRRFKTEDRKSIETWKLASPLQIFRA